MLQDGTPIIQRASINCEYQRPSEIHVSLKNIAVYYQSNDSLDYTVSRYI